jgi:hypothetical protein
LIAACLGYLSARSSLNRIRKIRQFADDIKKGIWMPESTSRGAMNSESLRTPQCNGNTTAKIIGELGSEKQTITAIWKGCVQGVLTTDLTGA